VCRRRVVSDFGLGAALCATCSYGFVSSFDLSSCVLSCSPLLVVVVCWVRIYGVSVCVRAGRLVLEGRA